MKLETTKSGTQVLSLWPDAQKQSVEMKVGFSQPQKPAPDTWAGIDYALTISADSQHIETRSIEGEIRRLMRLLRQAERNEDYARCIELRDTITFLNGNDIFKK